MNIGQAAERSGLPVKTIRYYEQIGLIEAPARRQSGYRFYDETDVQTLLFIQRARSLGFSVDDCRDLLALYRGQDRSAAEVKALALDRIGEIDGKIGELMSIRATLSALADRCGGVERNNGNVLKNFSSSS
ncbi:MerR family transcriptional regulator [Geminicoccus roseus]|uniref:MerR family transcriptional regulator n=1 Tax=Geminicoccus roseus TaxID=404900 RepID=UPI0003F55744|nr:MerR family transcriptional regulator [Geminicoccus roseus]